MKYALLGYASEGALDQLSDVERAAWEADDAAFHAQLADRRHLVHAALLADAETATTVQIVSGQCIIVDGPHDGPHGGDNPLRAVLMIDVPDLDAALAVARQCPAARTGAVEVRPVLPM